MVNTDFIRVEMARQRLTQTEIVSRTGLSPNTVSAICNGKDTRISTLQVFADALGVSMVELFTPTLPRVRQAEPLPA